MSGGMPEKFARSLVRPSTVASSRKRTGPPLPLREPPRCSGFLLPVSHQEVGEPAHCGKSVVRVAPPQDPRRDPRPGSTLATVMLHQSKPAGLAPTTVVPAPMDGMPLNLFDRTADWIAGTEFEAPKSF